MKQAIQIRTCEWYQDNEKLENMKVYLKRWIRFLKWCKKDKIKLESIKLYRQVVKKLRKEIKIKEVKING